MKKEDYYFRAVLLKSIYVNVAATDGRSDKSDKLTKKAVLHVAGHFDYCGATNW